MYFVIRENLSVVQKKTPVKKKMNSMELFFQSRTEQTLCDHQTHLRIKCFSNDFLFLILIFLYESCHLGIR